MEMSELGNNIMLYAGILTGAGIIIKIGLIPIKWIKKVAKDISDWFESIKTQIEKVDEKVDKIREVQDEHTIEILGLQVINQNMPDEKRYNSCKKYIELNGNSGIEITAQRYIEKYRKKYGEKLDEEVL